MNSREFSSFEFGKRAKEVIKGITFETRLGKL
jgi:hypothetical protein